MPFTEKIAVVTGAGSGIGRATALAFAAQGTQVIVADSDQTAIDDTVNAINTADGTALGACVDVSDNTQVVQMVQMAVEHYDGIDILVNSAGILRFGSVLDTAPESWQQVLAVNLTGVYLCCRAILPIMIQGGGGAIVNISSSTGAHDAHAGLAAYVASKGAVAMLTKAMAIDHAKDKIRINAIAPGPTDTPMLRDNLSTTELDTFAKTFPLQRLGQPEELAQAILYLASDNASFITGTILAVDGGQTAQI